MNCLKCGYQLNSFDEECPKCHGTGVFRTAPPAPQFSPWLVIKKWTKHLSCAVFLIGFCYFIWYKAYTYSQQDAVVEAVVRYRIKPESTGTIFLSVAGQDPSTGVLHRLKTANFKVRPWSQANRVLTQSGFRRNDAFLNDMFRYDHHDKETGKTGAPLKVSSPVWNGPFQALVEGDVFFGVDRYIVVRKNGQWIVDRTKNAIVF